MDFFSSSFNIIIALLIVSAVIWSFIRGRPPKKGTPARKKYDEKMAKEEWERLNPPTYKTIEEISKPKPKAKKQQDYVEPVITEKMIDDFVRFFDRSASTDFSEIDFSDLNIYFSVEVECDISVYEYGDIKCEELELPEEGYDEYLFTTCESLQREEIDGLEAEEFVRLIHQPSSVDPMKSPDNNIIFDYLWEDYEHSDGGFYKGTYFENGRELDFDKVSTNSSIVDQNNYTRRETKSVKVTEVDFSSIELSINGLTFNNQFTFENPDRKYILILLMCVYRQDLAEQINQALKAKDN